MTQGDDGDPGRLGLRNAEIHCQRSDRLTEAIAAIDHGMHRRLDVDRQRLPGDDLVALQPKHVARHPDHAVAVMSGQVRANQVMPDPGSLRFIAPGGAKQCGDVIGKGSDRNGRGRKIGNGTYP